MEYYMQSPMTQCESVYFISSNSRWNEQNKKRNTPPPPPPKKKKKKKKKRKKAITTIFTINQLIWHGYGSVNERWDKYSD